MHNLQQVFLLSVVLIVLISAAAAKAKVSAIAKPGCPDRCGNTEVPYPFGIGSKNCYFDKLFEVVCNQSTTPPLLYYSDNVSQILQFTKNDSVRMFDSASANCYNKRTGKNSWLIGFDFKDSPFTYSATGNKFTAIGCDFFAYIPSILYVNPSQNNYSYTAGCASFCNNETVEKHNNMNSCLGNIGCCQSTIPEGLKNFDVSLQSINTDGRFWKIRPCSFAFIVENDYYEGFDVLFQSTNDSFVLSGNKTRDYYEGSHLGSRSIDSSFPVIMDWAIGKKTCREAQREKNSSSYVCGVNSVCVDSKNGPGYKCRCFKGYDGNPYLPHGCQDIDECKEPNGRVCPRDTHCKNILGDYACDCPLGYHTYGTKGGTSCKHIKRKLPVDVVIPIGIGSGIIFVLLLVLSFWLYRRLQERKQIKLKQMYFKKNGGLLMKQKISSHDGGVEKAKIFAIAELEKVTDNFNQSRILGKGGFGTVYKGMLSDGRIVAIKKSKLENESQVDQFINEVVILSQINHRHIVRLLGCCLETQVPLLVYEYVSNGTLSQHLHSEGYYVSSISWKDRLRIASEIAGALAYLHSDASVPIFHRDMKSSNILLDENCKAKVSDFGLSRSVPIDQTHLTTVAQGTFGYIDPEYYRSGQYTDKSDVYSFGVVLVELITGERVISLARPADEKSLVVHFISALKKDHLFEILKAGVVTEGDKDEVMIVAKIAKRCLKLNGKKRPLMKEVAASLERLRKFQEQPWVEPNKLQVEDFLVGETSSRCATSTIFEVDDDDDDYDESNNSSLVST